MSNEAGLDLQGLLNEILALRTELAQKQQDAELAANLGQHLLTENTRLTNEIQEITENKDKIIKDLSTQLDQFMGVQRARSQSLTKENLIIELKKDNNRLQVIPQ